jgi:NAD(P)-dependent dehydrogenase (short-subunit alcohol dehydrogenase family)
MKLDGKIFIITGAAEGIGAAISRLLSENYAKLVLADLEKPDLQLDNSISLQYDPLSLKEVKGVVMEAVNHFGPKIDGIINTISTCLVRPVSKSDVDNWDYQMDFNFKSVFFLNQALAKQMIENGNGGVFLNLATTAALSGTSTIAAYSASQAAIMNLSNTMALELREHNIRSNCLIIPYIEDTALKYGELFYGKDPKRIRPMAFTFSPMMELIQPSEIAKMALFLVSEDSQVMNGQTIGILDDELTNIRNILNRIRLKR